MCSGLRPTDGSPIVRLSPGGARDSPTTESGRSSSPLPAEPAVVLPTGPGQAIRSLPRRSGAMLSVNWFPDGKQILYYRHRARTSTETLRAGHPVRRAAPGHPGRLLHARHDPERLARRSILLCVRADDTSTWIFPSKEESRGASKRSMPSASAPCAGPRTVEASTSGLEGHALPDFARSTSPPAHASRGNASRPPTLRGAEDTPARAPLGRWRDVRSTRFSRNSRRSTSWTGSGSHALGHDWGELLRSTFRDVGRADISGLYSSEWKHAKEKLTARTPTRWRASPSA